MPFSWAAARPRAIWTAQSTALRSGQLPGRERLPQRLALEQLHDEDVAARENRKNRGFLRMSKGWRSQDGSGSRAASLLARSAPSLFTFEELFREDLDRDVSSEPRVLRPIHLSHSPRPERRDHLIGAEAGTRNAIASARSLAPETRGV